MKGHKVLYRVMMPFNKRLDFGFLTTLGVAIGYLLSFFLLMAGLIGYDLITDPDTPIDPGSLMVFLLIGTIFVLIYGFFVGISAWISGMLFPVVVVSRRYWLGPGCTGLLCAVTLSVLSMSLIFNTFSATEFVILVVVSGIGIFLSRVIGLTFGWARPWYPPGACETCGYDLRQTPVGGNCPECGAVAEKPFVRKD